MKNQAPLAPYINTNTREFVAAAHDELHLPPGLRGTIAQRARGQVARESRTRGARAPPGASPAQLRLEVSHATSSTPRERGRPCSSTCPALLWAVVLFLAVTVVTYVIFFVMPANPAQLAAGQGATPADVAAGRGAPPPRPAGLRSSTAASSSSSSVEQSLGTSFVNRQDVNDIVLRAAPVTASLVFGGAIFWMLLALPIGILSALRPRSLFDRAGDDVRPDRDLRAPGLDRADPRVLLRLQARAGRRSRGYCDFFNPLDRTAAGPCSGPTT